MIRIPESDFGRFRLPRLVMGCSPFELHTHPYVNPKKKMATYSASFRDLDEVMKIISAAADFGIDTINLGRHMNLIDLAERIKRERTDIRIIPSYIKYLLRSEMTPFQVLEQNLPCLRST